MRAAVCLAVFLVAARAAFAEQYPMPRSAPERKAGGWVSVPGAPLPSVPADSVTTAIRLYKPFLGGLRRVFPEKPIVARGCGYLATLYASIGDLRNAEALFDEAQRILEKNGATDELAWVHNNRGLVQTDNARYAEAVRSFRTAISLLDPAREEHHEWRVIGLQNLASTYALLGDPENSESYFLDSLELLRRMKQEGTPRHQASRANLAAFYSGINDFGAARQILEELLAEPGLSRVQRLQALLTISYALSGLEEFGEAERRLKEARALTADGTAARALAVMNLAAMYGWSGDYARGTEVGEQALRLTKEVYGEGSRPVAAVMVNLGAMAMHRGELLKADRLLVSGRTILGQGSGDQEAFLFATRALALLAQKRGQETRARELSREALDLATEQLERILAFGSEAQRLAYQFQSTPYDQLAHLGEPDLLAEAVLTMKGAVLDSLLAERALARRSRTASDREQLDRISALKLEIMEKIGRGESDLDALQRALKNEETALAKRLAPRLRLSRTRADLAAVQASLARDEVLVEIVRYQRYENGGKSVPSYGGIVVPPGGAPAWVPLGDADPLEDAIASLVGPFDRGTRSAAVEGQRSNDAASTLRELHERLWKPLAAAMPGGTRRVLLSPDAATSFLPWAALLDGNGRFLAERWQITQLGSGRDINRAATESPGRTILALGDGGDDLPFSRREVEAVARTAREHGWRATTFLGAQATEDQLFRVSGPRILHLATHAGQLHGDAGSVQNRLRRNPMYRGYLLLGGGYETLDDWKRGAATPFPLDGILTAEEASGLDLGATWLTVLSACQTGTGDLRAGEGVLGLRRGFVLAGTRNLVFSLWPVRDDATAEFMSGFYERLFRGGDPVRAFHETQVRELRRWKERDGVPAALYRAAGFVFTR